MKNRGFGRVFQAKFRDRKTGEKTASPTWSIAYSSHGKVIRESAHSTKRSDAVKLLKRRHAEIAAGRPVGPDVEKTTFEDMALMLTTDYKANARKSLDRVEDINHLRGYFAGWKAVEITGDRVTAYVAHRQEEKAAASTVNSELAALGRMFTLAIRAGKAAGKPYIAKLELNNARKGFFEREQLDAVLKHVSDDLKPMLETAYITGWRVPLGNHNPPAPSCGPEKRLASPGPSEKARIEKAGCFR